MVEQTWISEKKVRVEPDVGCSVGFFVKVIEIHFLTLVLCKVSDRLRLSLQRVADLVSVMDHDVDFNRCFSMRRGLFGQCDWP